MSIWNGTPPNEAKVGPIMKFQMNMDSKKAAEWDKVGR
jgi:hypothetical protein